MAKKVVSSSGGGSNGSPIDISIKEASAFLGVLNWATRQEAIANGYFSVKDFSEKTGYSIRACTNMLNSGVESRTLEYIVVKAGGHKARYFRPIKKKS